MLGLKRKTNYGLELMIALAKNYQQGPTSLRKIAKEKKLPYKFLEQIVIPLREAELVKAKEGKGGGYFLKKDPAKVSLAEIVEVLEGPVKVGQCFACPMAQVCGDQKDVWSEVGEKVKETIEGKTLADLI